MGARLADRHIVQAMIGPGPRARHTRYSFKPDAEWQWKEIASIFTASAGAATYIGDWHTHPGASRAALSELDLQAMAEILSDPRSQTCTVTTVILNGEHRSWAWSAWMASFRQDRRHGRERMVVQRVEVQFVDAA